MKTKNFEKDVVKALKRSAREEYGIQPTRVAGSKKAYSRKKYNIKKDIENGED